ncbi:hypothetical protein HDV05_003533 [Chytridiales sp. JEL 0842]|nr:hypothetical protein HDV05_003533 [Chytridiales sp. JEL 0842]
MEPLIVSTGDKPTVVSENVALFLQRLATGPRDDGGTGWVIGLDTEWNTKFGDKATSPADSDHILHQIYTNKALAQARNAAKWSRNILHPIYDSRDYSEFAKKFVEYLEEWEAKRKRREAEKKKIKREKAKVKKARAVDADEENGQRLTALK